MNLNLLKKSKRVRKQAGIALVTTLLLLFMMSSLLVGFSILLASSQKQAGTSTDQVTAFYGAEAGMEKMTSDLGNLFNITYSPSIAQINALETVPPVVPGVSFLEESGSSGYLITPLAVDSNGNPAPTISTIKSGTYQGMTAMATEYTLMTNARTPEGLEVTLKRTTQTVGIPMFQFGIFCDPDCSFFPGPNFNFGGRMHTNGNLYLAAGSTLTMSDKVDAYKDVIRDSLSNGYNTASNYPGNVSITISPGGSSYRDLAYSEGSISGLTLAAIPTWPTVSQTNYNGNLQNGAGSLFPAFAGNSKKLNLGIVTIGAGATQSIDLIRRSIPGEGLNVTAERYFSQASLRILLSDDPTDIMNSTSCLDGTVQPFDLGKMATTPPANWGTSAYAPLVQLDTKMKALGVPELPLALSGALGGAGYNQGALGVTPIDGYWQPAGYPAIRGFLKIEEQLTYGSSTGCGTWKDVTLEVLSYGYVGRNIDPVPQSFDGQNMNPQWYSDSSLNMGLGASPGLPNPPSQQLAYQNSPAYPLTSLPTQFTGIVTPASNPKYSCPDPHPYAIIRLERIRDNPSTVPFQGGTYKVPVTNLPKVATVAQVCGLNAVTGQPDPALTATDFWPNVLFDTREGTLRDTSMNAANLPTLNGAMSYIEVDGKNLAGWFGGKINTFVTSGQGTKDPAVAPNDFVFYVSDRRGNYAGSQTLTGSWPPVSYTRNETGEYGWTDIVNLTSSNGCPNVALDTGEDIDNVNGTSYGLFWYGASANYIHAPGVSPYASLLNGQLGILSNVSTKALAPNISCGTPTYSSTDGIWPMMVATSANAPRENPPLFFRRAIKLVNGANLTAVGPCPSGVSCGLTVSSENPIYIQGDYNANAAGNTGFADSNEIATSVAGDAVTLLSVMWNDANSFSSTYNMNNRVGATTYYRTAVIAGKTQSFPNPSGTSQDFGTDGGVHNFLRYIENWGPATLNYEGSMVALYTSRQAIGTFKCCTTVYSPPGRGYNFDTNFLNPTLLPPRTPLFRAINTTGWTRLLLPGQYN